MIQAKAKEAIDEVVFQRFCDRLYYHQGDIHQEQCYSELANTLNDKANKFPKNIAFYLSISPADFGKVMEMLSNQHLFDERFRLATGDY